MEKRILHFANIFIPYISGTSVRISNLCANYNKHVIITEKKKSQKLNVEEISNDKNFNIHRLNIRFRYGNFNFIKYYTLRYKIFTDYVMSNIDQQKIDVVYGHNPYEFAKASYEYAEKFKKPFIYEVHGCMYDASTNYYRKIMNKSLEKKIMNSADIIVVQTNSMLNRIIEIYNIDINKIHVIYNGINEDMYENIDKVETENLTRRLSINNKFVVGYFGSLDTVNGIDRIIKIFKERYINNSEVIFLLAGDGPLRMELESLSKEYSNLLYLGAISNSEIAIYYKLLNLFILPRPSTMATETLLPMKLLEVMFGEIPILASDVKGITEVLNDNNAVIFDKNSDNDLADSLDYCIKNYKEIFTQEKLKQSKRYVEQNFTWKNSQMKLNNIIKDL